MVVMVTRALRCHTTKCSGLYEDRPKPRQARSKYESNCAFDHGRRVEILAAPALAIASLETEEARNAAVEAIENGADIRKAVRGAKKLDYNKRIQATKPKALEGTCKIILADPPWKYHGLNQADEYGHAERHYDCLDDDQLCTYRPGSGKRTVKELVDINAVLFV